VTSQFLSAPKSTLCFLALTMLLAPLANAEQIALNLSGDRADATLNAQSAVVPETTDLQSLGEQSRQTGLPIILVFSAENCSHCERLEEDVLRPMLFSGELKNQGLLRKYRVDGAVSIRDFQGRSRDAEDYSILRDVEFTPTIQFVDSEGRQIVPPIIGYQTPDLFQAYFRESISVSRKILHDKRQ